MQHPYARNIHSHQIQVFPFTQAPILATCCQPNGEIHHHLSELPDVAASSCQKIPGNHFFLVQMKSREIKEISKSFCVFQFGFITSNLHPSSRCILCFSPTSLIQASLGKSYWLGPSRHTQHSRLKRWHFTSHSGLFLALENLAQPQMALVRDGLSHFSTNHYLKAQCWFFRNHNPNDPSPSACCLRQRSSAKNGSSILGLVGTTFGQLHVQLKHIRATQNILRTSRVINMTHAISRKYIYISPPAPSRYWWWHQGSWFLHVLIQM